MNGSLFDRLLAASSSTEFVVVGPDGTVEKANPAFAEHVASPGDELPGRRISELMPEADGERLRRWLGDGPPREPVRLNFLAAGGLPYTLHCLVERDDGRLRVVGEPDVAGDRTAAEELMRLNNELTTMARERARRERELERTRKELQETLEELRTSYWHLQKIQEVLPLCMECGMVKAEEARWRTVVDYLRENEIFVSHGYCPACAEKVAGAYGLEPEDRDERAP